MKKLGTEMSAKKSWIILGKIAFVIGFFLNLNLTHSLNAVDMN